LVQPMHGSKPRRMTAYNGFFMELFLILIPKASRGM
jgi:hypothetical protein